MDKVVYALNNDIGQGRRLITSKVSLSSAFFVLLYSSAIFYRLMYVQLPFSYDYGSYLSCINSLNYMPFLDMFEKNFIFPYVVSNSFWPIEIGFALFVKIVLLLGVSPEATFAIMASTSVALRVYTMEALKVPRPWILFLNIYAITLFEANALRLGIASSILLFGLLQIQLSHKLRGLILLLIAIFFHVQVVIFIFPFLVFYVFSKWASHSRTRVSLALVASSIATLVFSQFISFSQNEKIIVYVSQGASESAGVTVTSILAAIFLISAAQSTIQYTIKGELYQKESKFWFSILFASVPSLVLLIFVTDISVIGDRSWQLAFLILLPFFFFNRQIIEENKKIIPLIILFVLCLIIFTNIIIRYPLSDFFSPPFPAIIKVGHIF